MILLYLMSYWHQPLLDNLLTDGMGILAFCLFMESLVLWKLEMCLDSPGSKTLVCVHPAAIN